MTPRGSSNIEIMSMLTMIIGRMEDYAGKHKIKGVAVTGCYSKADGVISLARACGLIFDDKCNYLAIAYAKLSEMCNTLKESGVQGRLLLHGELGYVGGALKSVGKVCYIAAYSGGSGAEDLAISKHGLEAAHG